MTDATDGPEESVVRSNSGSAAPGPTKRRRQNTSRKARAAKASIGTREASVVPPVELSTDTVVDSADASHSGDTGNRPGEALPAGQRKPRAPRNRIDGAATESTPIEEHNPAAQSHEEVLPKPSGTARPKPQTLSELIQAAYVATTKFGMSGADFEVLERNATVTEPVPDEGGRLVDEVARRDLTLRGLVNLLAPVAQHAKKRSLLRERVAEVAAAALLLHPLFRAYADTQPRTSAGLPDVTAVRIWLRAPQVAEDLGLSESQRRTLRANAVVSYSLLRLIHDEWSVDEFVDAMAETVWSSRPDAASRPLARAAIMTGTGDHELPVRLGILHEQMISTSRRLEKQLSASRAEAWSSTKRATEAEARASALEADLESLETRLSGVQAELASATSQLRAEQERGSVARSHHADDYEALRTQVLRQLSKQVDLLSDGLHAVRNERYAVAEEFVDRALSAITREVSNLREAGEN